MDIQYIIFGSAVAILLWVWVTYNSFITLRFRFQEALSDIDVQAKRRYDLIPNLIEAVKGYMGQERTVLENVTKARTVAMSSGATGVEKAGLENMLSGALKTLFAVSESYPDLKSSTNFLELQRELTDTEDKMMAARRFYNSVVRELNIKVHTVPSNVIASTFGFKDQKFFEVGNVAEKQPVQVKF